MASTVRHPIVGMDWNAFENSLQGVTRGRGRPAEEKALREYFGDEEYEHLRSLAEHTRMVRARAPMVGNVVFLHGIMGSNLLTVEKDGDEDLVWVNLLRLAAGQIARLRLTPDGRRDADPKYKVQVGDLDKRTYARAILWLRGRWNVAPFAFDWRRDIDEAADALAVFIRKQFPAGPVHLVAHSMGGLVSRNFIHRHHDLWQQMADADGGTGGGRLVMLGTPNYGSFAIPQAMTGVEKLVRLLATADVTHDLDDVLDVLNSFVGSYEMLPAPSKLPSAAQVIYRQETWGTFPISNHHLKRAFQFHDDLAQDADTVDPTRMLYIAGCNQETVSGLTVVTPGEFDYTATRDGDGRVPHALGLLKDVPTYYVEEAHGDLPRNEKVLAAVDDLLEHGTTSALPDRPIPARGIVRASGRWQRSTTERQVDANLRDIASALAGRKGARPPSEDIRRAEETLTRAVTGGAIAPLKPTAVPRTRRHDASPKLKIDLVLGDITKISTPVAVLGHYKGAALGGAEGQIDRALGGWIRYASEFGMIPGDLGSVFFIPVPRQQIAPRGVLLACMGESGRFARDELRCLMMNVTFAVAALGLDRFASVVIGSGKGNLSKEQALRNMLLGIADAMEQLKSFIRVDQLTLTVVEADRTAFDQIKSILESLGSMPKLQVEYSIRKPGRAPRGRPHEEDTRDTQERGGTRITIERTDKVFRFSALSDTAVVPVRDIEVNPDLAAAAGERLMTARTPEEQDKYGRLLYTYLMPEDFRQLMDGDGPITLILDSSTAAFPWEMACFGSTRGRTYLGPDRQLTRQFRTLLSSVPGIRPPVNRDLRVLVVADPAPEPELQLPGARREGREVVAVLNELARKYDVHLEVVDRVGPTECDPVEILALLLNDGFDVVHFAGHGMFDQEDPARGGWVFSKEHLLSAREIFRARRVPRLVFANACFSAVVRQGAALSADETNRRLAGLAQAFFERGVQNYLGAGWPVDDGPAVTFAKTFYENVLRAETLGTAIAAARGGITEDGPTWGAYQHYGDANARLLTPT